MDILNFFFEPYKSYSFIQILLEAIAAIAGIISVFLIGKRNILGYPTGIISTLLYSVLLWHWNLMGDMLINIYYTFMSLYGWINWFKFQHTDHTIKVQKMNSKDYLPVVMVLIISFVFTMLIYSYRPYLEKINFNFDFQGIKTRPYQWTDYVDATSTSIFLIAMWLMANRKIENWLFWITGNIISIPLYLFKGYGITSLQYFVFLILAITGFQKWKNSSLLLHEKATDDSP